MGGESGLRLIPSSAKVFPPSRTGQDGFNPHQIDHVSRRLAPASFGSSVSPN